MNKEFIPYEQALQLKELGFDKLCLGYYYHNNHFITCNPSVYDSKDFTLSLSIPPENSCNAPLYQQAFRWFMEKYNLRGFIGFRPNVKQFDCHVYDMSLSGKEYVQQRTMGEFNKDPKVGTYEEAELACLNKLIEICLFKK